MLNLRSKRLSTTHVHRAQTTEESMTKRKHEQNLDRDDERFETALTWIISKVMGGATFFFIVALAAQWGTMKYATTFIEMQKRLPRDARSDAARRTWHTSSDGAQAWQALHRGSPAYHRSFAGPTAVSIRYFRP
jgi:hypothetical protein